MKENTNKKLDKWLNFEYKIDVNNKKDKEDSFRAIKLTRVNPNGEYGNYTIEKGITKEQLKQIESILGIGLKDYRFN